MEEINIVYVPITQLKPATYNPREISAYEFEALKKSIVEFGFVEPVVVNKDYSIIGGHQRVEAAKKLGIEKVPVVIIDVSAEQAKLLNLALNRISGEWDKEKLKDLLLELNNLSLDLSLTGFTSEEVSTLLDFTKEDNYQPPPDLPTRVKLGEVWQLGNHRLLCGDSTKKEDIEKLMAGEKAQLLFTDPPYNVDYTSSSGGSYATGKYKHPKVFNDNLSDSQYYEFLTAALTNAYQYTTDSMSLYLFFASRNYSLVRQVFESAGFYYSQMIVWVKDRFVLSQGQDFHRMFEPAMYGWKKDKKHWFNKSYSNISDVITVGKQDFLEQLDVWYEERDNTNEYVHPTQKPVRLAERALKKSTKPDDLVLELFGGSGSTLIACEQMQRRCFVVELDPLYCDAIIDRWEKLTGQEAKRL